MEAILLFLLSIVFEMTFLFPWFILIAVSMALAYRARNRYPTVAKVVFIIFSSAIPSIIAGLGAIIIMLLVFTWPHSSSEVWDFAGLGIVIISLICGIAFGIIVYIFSIVVTSLARLKRSKRQ
ncbi:MAG TPA: hypothetical protein EYP78_02180 [Candidatus Omnitrophica bacterium]|nr:hypothetical protein [Candidatus Omnitrophota bacterium]